ncbi:MAG: hypothetical protein LBF89_07215 [Bacteroidales bacterium]|nr:hypothetical protein [Bacteroidales bacterium]
MIFRSSDIYFKRQDLQPIFPSGTEQIYRCHPETALKAGKQNVVYQPETVEG